MNFYDVLAAKNWDGGIPTINFFDLLFAQSISGEQWQTYEGILPATFNANGDDMRQYQAYGNTGGVGEEADITGLSEPLCGIGTYTDSLDLSTGILTRRIRKLVLTGEETWLRQSSSHTKCINLYMVIGDAKPNSTIISNVVIYDNLAGVNNDTTVNVGKISISGENLLIDLSLSDFPNITAWKNWLAQQYATETPVTVWYILATPEVSTITVPSGLTGTIEGYLIQDGTPTPETPIYPTANGVKQAGDTYSIKYGYKLDISTSDGTNVTTTPIYIGDEPLDKDEYVDYGAQKLYRMIDGTLTPTDPPVPLPALPTCEGETVVDYAGSGAAPEKVYFEYKQKR